MSKARHPSPRRFWRACRVYFRRFRIAVWLLILTVLGCFIYVNQIGLPDFIKDPLLDKVRAQGIDLQFSRLRLRWIEGVVAENVRFGPADEPGSPSMLVREVQVKLNHQALMRMQVQVDGLRLRDGRLVWPLLQTNAPPRQLKVENLYTSLRFLENDEWALDDLVAEFGGARLRFSGNVTNASAIRSWSFLQTRPSQAGKEPKSLDRRVRLIADTLERIRFSVPPELKLHVTGDATDLLTFQGRLSITAPGAETPWGSLSEGRFTAVMFPVTNGISQAEINLVAGGSRTRWASITNFQLHMHLLTSEAQNQVVSGRAELTASRASTPWCEATNTKVNAEWVHSVTNPIPLSGTAAVISSGARTRWAAARNLSLDLDFQSAASHSASDPQWGWWTNLEPYQVGWNCRADYVQYTNLTAETVRVSGNWKAPHLVVSNLYSTLYKSGFELAGNLDVSTRIASATVATDLDPRHVFSVLPQSAINWLGQFTWSQAPRASATASVSLPPWVNRPPDWQQDLVSSLNLRGQFEVDGGGTFKGVPVSGARSRFTYEDMKWHLPDLTVFRPEGRVVAEHRADDRTREIYWRVESNIDPSALKPLLPDQGQQAFDLVSFSVPPRIAGEVWGIMRQPEAIRLRAHVSVTNFLFRGESALGLESDVVFDQGLLTCLNPVIVRTNGLAKASGLLVDFAEHKAFLTNGFSNTDPMVIGRAIGREVANAIQPYHFNTPPTARVSGVIPLKGVTGADLHFELVGEQFSWWKFHIDRLAGHVHWSGEKVHLKDIQADFYQGKATGFANFDFSRKGTDFEFAATVTNSLFQFLVADLSPGTNRLEGRLNGTVSVTGANSGDWRTVQGYGSAELRDGFIWDIPLFGAFSPVLNTISPGLGNSKASAAQCSFMIQNGVVRTDDMDIRAQGMRLQYRGSVDLENNVNARVEAVLLRDMWLVGPLVSTVFWPVSKAFEYRMTGTLGKPVLEPVYIFPKLMSLPFQPFRTIKNLFDEGTSKTNAPPPVGN